MTAPNGQRALDPHEHSYLSGVALALRDLDRITRRDLLASARQNLAERLVTTSLAELTEQLGDPAGYTAGLRADADAADPGRLARSRRRRHVTLWWTWGAAVVALAAVVFGVRWWVTWDPGFVQDAQRVCAGAEGPECDQTGFVDSDITDMTQVPCTGTLMLTAAILAGSDVSVTAASLPGLRSPDDPGMADPTYGPMILIDEVQVWKRPNLTEPARPSTWPAVTGPSPDLTELHFHLTLCPRPLLRTPGNTQFIERIQIDYHALGRNRTTVIPLLHTIAVTVPERG
jgi:hypothetical protein